MRKRTLAYLLTIAMAAALSGCGKEETAPEEIVQTEEETAAKETAPEEEENADAEGGETETMKEEAEEPADWLAANGMAVTPQGDFSLNCPVTVPQEDNSLLIAGREDVAESVEMTENIVGEHKEITVTLTRDTSVSESYYSGLDLDIPPELIRIYKVPADAVFFFDRYTGDAIECLGGGVYTEMVEGDTVNGLKIWGEGGGNEQAAFYLMKSEIQDTYAVTELTLYCPTDYDGAVFSVLGWPQEPGEVMVTNYAPDAETLTETLKKTIDVTKWQRYPLDPGQINAIVNGGFKIGNGGLHVQELMGENCRLFTVTDK